MRQKCKSNPAKASPACESSSLRVPIRLAVLLLLTVPYVFPQQLTRMKRILSFPFSDRQDFNAIEKLNSSIKQVLRKSNLAIRITKKSIQMKGFDDRKLLDTHCLDVAMYQYLLSREHLGF